MRWQNSSSSTSKGTFEVRALVRSRFARVVRACALEKLNEAVEMHPRSSGTLEARGHAEFSGEFPAARVAPQMVSAKLGPRLGVCQAVKAIAVNPEITTPAAVVADSIYRK